MYRKKLLIIVTLGLLTIATAVYYGFFRDRPTSTEEETTVTVSTSTSIKNGTERTESVTFIALDREGVILDIPSKGKTLALYQPEQEEFFSDLKENEGVVVSYGENDTSRFVITKASKRK